MLNSDLNARSQSLTAQSVSRRVKYEKMNITTNIGTMGTTIQTSTTVRHLTQRDLKTIKFSNDKNMGTSDFFLHTTIGN
jgi:hypothetical protein